MKQNFKFIDLFAGIGGIRIPFEELGGKCVFSSDIDQFAQKTYEANFHEMPHGDITKIDVSQIPNHDILLAGFPCQPFSIMGDGLGFADTRGTLFFEIERILEAKKPESFLLENVKRLVNHDKGKTFQVIQDRLEKLGYNIFWKVLNALDYGLPQKRERIVIVGFRNSTRFTFPEKFNTKTNLKDFLEPHESVDKQYFASPQIVKNRLKSVKGKKFSTPTIWHENKSGNIGVNEFSCALRAGASHNYLLVDGIRRLTPREFLNLQGYPSDFKIVVNYTQIKKQTGNSVPINMIREVSKEMMKSLIRKPRQILESEIHAK
jgi:DNA (cytosine-5)-methyltransferase 1